MRTFRLCLRECFFGSAFFSLTTLAFTVVSLSVLSLSGAAYAQPVPPELVNGLKWRLIGPFRGGRAVAVAGVPGDSATFYFGSVNGGIWKTTDAGVTWTPIFDGQAVSSIGALAVAPSNPKIIYAGTGESDIREDLSTGNGVYKSTDGGASWNQIGLEETRQISRIMIDPRDANVVYVGALGHAYGPSDERGVYKSVDGGAHWALVLNLGPEIGISDLAICSAAPQLLFAGAWHTHRPPWSTYAPIDGPGGGLYRSQDGGKTWTRLDHEKEKNGLPGGEWGRVGVDVATDGKRIYALIETKKPGENTAEPTTSGLYRSADGGNSWALVNTDKRLTDRAWYFNRVTIDPQNRDVIYMPNVALYRSEDGGKTISVLRGAPGGDDYHQLWIDPRNSASMVLGTDQGTTVSLNRGQTWSSWYNQPTAQFYHVTTDNQFPYVVYGTQQDSGSAAVLSRSDHGSITPRDWFVSGESESGYMVVDPHDPDIVYLTGTYGTVDRFDGHVGFSQNISPWPVFRFDAEIDERKYRDPWTPALVASPIDATTIYLGTQYVMKTVDGGLHWETISGDLTGARSGAHDAADEKTAGRRGQGPSSLERAKAEGFGVVYAIAPSPLNRDLIWAGSDMGLIHITRDGGKNWKDISPRGLGDWSKISVIEASHFDPAVAYAAVDRGRLDDRTPYLYRTRDYGASWQLITGGINAPAFLRSVREDPKSRGLLFAGTEFGVYVSFDDGDHWQPLQLNLPTTSVRDLTIHGDDLVIATFGRAFWVLDDITPLRQALEAMKAGGAWLYRPATGVRVDNDSFPGTPLPPEEPTAENPPDGAVMDYFLPSRATTVQLEVFDEQQNLVRKFSSDDPVPAQPPMAVAERWFEKPEVIVTSAGLHRFVWDLNWGSSGAPNSDEDAGFREPSGPKITPGMYQIRLTVDGRAQDASLKVVMDPRSSATAEVLEQQFQLGKKIFGETVDARRALMEIESVEKQLAELQQKLGVQNRQLKAELADVQMEIGKILENKERAVEARLGLKEANADLASALRVVESGDRTVPSQAIAVYEESSAQVKGRIAEWERFKQMRLIPLNQHLRDAKVAPVAIAGVEQR